MSTYKQIRQAMHDNEKAVIAHIKKYGSVGEGFCSPAWQNAIDRLVNAKKLKYSKDKSAYIIR